MEQPTQIFLLLSGAHVFQVLTARLGERNTSMCTFQTEKRLAAASLYKYCLRSRNFWFEVGQQTARNRSSIWPSIARNRSALEC